MVYQTEEWVNKYECTGSQPFYQVVNRSRIGMKIVSDVLYDWNRETDTNQQ